MLMLTHRADAAVAECLFVNANPGTNYGNRSFTNVVWGDGYPAVSVEFITNPNIVFTGFGGGAKQRFANNGLAVNTLNNDNPAFISVYTNTLRLNAMIGDTGTVTTTYTFASPMTLVDLIVCDVDDDDTVRITPKGPGGVSLPPSLFEIVDVGDLSLTNNAGGRPALEVASPPQWDETTGILSAIVPWNENRSFTILRVPEGTAVQSIALEFTGSDADTDGPEGPGLGAHIYVALWATPRDNAVDATQSADGQLLVNVPTLPGLSYAIASSSNLVSWFHEATLIGPAAPIGQIEWVDAGWTNATQTLRYYRYGRSTN